MGVAQTRFSHLLASKEIEHGGVPGEPQEAGLGGANLLGQAAGPALSNVHADGTARDICETQERQKDYSSLFA